MNGEGILSIVIVRVRRGYIASLRFKDKRQDTDLSSNSRFLLYGYIEKYIRRYR